MIAILLILFGAALGGGVSAHIYRKKQAHTKLACPRRAHCDRVIHSTFSTTFGIKNEIAGLGYYLLVLALAFVILGAGDSALGRGAVQALAVLSLAGICFSVYLIIVQFAVLRAWCAWCLLSALATLSIALGVVALLVG